MAQRIRYKETKEPGVVVSTKTYTSARTGAQYKVYLNLNDVTYKIKNVNSENVYRGGENINNLNVLKRNVKARLESMGVQFEGEERWRSFGLCPKGMTQEKWLKHKELEKQQKKDG